MDTKRLRCFALACALALPLHAVAELSNEPLIGAGLRVRPAYDGSSSSRMELVPVVRYFGQPWFVRTTQGVAEGGARMALAPGLHLGAQLAYEPGREASEAAFLATRNVADIGAGASIGAHVEWDTKIGPAPLNLLARVRQNTDSDLGAQADLRVTLAVFKRGPVAAALSTQATWANAKSTGAYYGVTLAQSVATGLPVHAAGGGLLYGSLGLLWGVELTQRWLVVGNLEARRLSGDAERSPLTERDTSYYASAGLAYRF